MQQGSEEETQYQLPSTSTPVKLGGPSSHDHVQISPVKPILRSQEAEASHGDIGLDSYVKFLHEDDTPECRQLQSQSQSQSAGSSWQEEFTKCDICHTVCRIANHLRRSKECVTELKSLPKFQFKGSDKDEVMIVKIALMIGECPSTCCSTGRHSEIPPECIGWWKSEGWNTMRWRGDREAADAHIIKEKIRDFVRKHRTKKPTQVQSQSGTQAAQAPTDVEDRFKCRSCGYGGDLIQHFFESSQCLEAYMEMFLPVTEDEVDNRESIFRLSIVLNLCARVECAQKTNFKYIAPHLNKNEECLKFYQSEGIYLDLPNWNPDASASVISKWIKKMRRAIKEVKEKEQSIGCTHYREELSQILRHICGKCAVMGPEVGEEDFGLRGGWSRTDGERMWFCSKCTTESPDFEEVKQKLKDDSERLKGQRGSEESDLKVVRLPRSEGLIVVPRSLTDTGVDVPQYVASLSTLVLVPSHPSAIRANMRWCDEVVKDKYELEKCAHELLKRPIISDFLPTFSCLYRSLIATLRQQMGRISMGLSKVARGEVVALNPNITSARKQQPNIELTIQGAMRDTCKWSFPSERQRSKESEARSQVNGQVKLYVRGTILMGTEDQDLRKILLLGWQSFIDADAASIDAMLDDPTFGVFIIKMAPVILKYVRSKVKLFIKHIVAPNFSNHDLRLNFDDHQLKVEIHGYVFAKQFNQVNRMLAADPTIRLLPEITSRVLSQQEVLPTTTLDWRQVAALYNIEELRAKEIVDVAQRCQEGDVASPLSMLNILTPSELTPSEQEKVLRNRTEELSNERNNGDDVIEAIVDITRIIKEEGLFEELITEEIDTKILQDMKKILTEMCPDQANLSPDAIHILMWYHTLLLRTGGKNQWTLKRDCGEALVVAYHPLLLEALQQKVEVRVVMETECSEAEQQVDEDLPDDQMMAGFAWKDISILKFLDGVSKEKYTELASQITVSVITSQEAEFNFKDSDEKDEEYDDIFVNSKGENFIISNGDLRKLYTKRPDVAGVKDMTFAQFIIDYYRKTSRQKVILDPVTGVGEESEEPIVGGEMRAPMAMKLSNNVIMKKRRDKNRPVPLFFKSNTLDSFGERMLFQPWRSVDELLRRQSEEDKEKQKQNRLELFPMAIFPRGDQVLEEELM